MVNILFVKINQPEGAKRKLREKFVNLKLTTKVI